MKMANTTAARRSTAQAPGLRQNTFALLPASVDGLHHTKRVTWQSQRNVESSEVSAPIDV